LIDRFSLPISVTRSLSYRRKRTQEKLTYNTSLSQVILESASPDFKKSYLLRVAKSVVLLIKCSIRTYFFHALTALVSLDILIVEVSISHSDTPQSVGILWTSDRPVAETSTWQHATLKRDTLICPRRDSNQ